MNAALVQLRAEGYPVRDEDLARLSPFARHLGVHGRYWFVLPASPAAFASCVTRTPKTTTGSGSEATSRWTPTPHADCCTRQKPSP